MFGTERVESVGVMISTLRWSDRTPQISLDIGVKFYAQSPGLLFTIIFHHQRQIVELKNDNQFHILPFMKPPTEIPLYNKIYLTLPLIHIKILSNTKFQEFFGKIFKKMFWH